jgi:hypothetical protein
MLSPALAAAQTPTLSATLTLAGLPTTLTLCRDSTAIQTYGVDEQWDIPIDIDANANTGGLGGIDVILLVTTPFQAYPCNPTVVNTQDTLLAAVLKWNAAQQNYVDSGITPALTLDFNAHTMTVTTDLTGDLANLAGNSKLSGAALASYTASGNIATSAYDNTGATTPGDSISDPGGDVQGCTTPCSAAASYYPIIDIVGLSSTTSQPLDTFGVNTLTVEFDLASLPTNLNLCEYPGLFSSFPGVDYGWVANLDVDNNPNSGLNGFEVIIEAFSTQQPQGCSTNAVPFAQGISADLEQWDDAQQNYVQVVDLPVTVDLAAGKIFVQADRSLAALSGLSASSPMVDLTVGLYNNGQMPYAEDVSSLYALGKSFVDPGDDVSNCSTPCATNVNWYPQIDLVGGSAHLPNRIFSSGFE